MLFTLRVCFVSLHFMLICMGSCSGYCLFTWIRLQNKQFNDSLKHGVRVT